MRLLVFVFLLFPVLGVAQEPEPLMEPVTPEEDTVPEIGFPCAVGADQIPAWWDDSERWAWEQICVGEVADMRVAPDGEPEAGCDTQDDSFWPGARALSQEFILQISTQEPWTTSAIRRAVRIRCALVLEPLNFWHARVPLSLEISDTRFNSFLNFDDARIDGSLLLTGSNSPSIIYGRRLAVKDRASLARGQFGGANLLSANIGGNLEVSGSSFSGHFNGNSLEVGGSLVMRRHAQFTSVDLQSATIGSVLDANGSGFSATFNAAGAKVGEAVYLSNNATFSSVILQHAEIGGNFVASGSSFSGHFDANGLKVGKSLLLNRDSSQAGDHPASRGASTFVSMDLRVAKIEGNLEASGSYFSDLLDFSGAEIGGHVYLTDEAKFSGVRLQASRVAKNLTADGARFSEWFDANGSVVGGNVFLRYGATFRGISLVFSRVGGLVSATGSSFTGLFDADGMTVGDALFLRGGASFERINLTGARIGGTAQFQNSDFAGEVDLSGLRIEDALMLSSFGSHARFGPEASLDLRNALIGSLQAAMPQSKRLEDGEHPWRRPNGAGGHEPLPVDLSNFTYERLGSFGEDAGSDLSKIEADPLVMWVEQSRTAWEGADGYAPQPYMHLATTLRGAGAEAAAEIVDYERMLHRMETRDHRWQREIDELARSFVGFGIYPERALIWFAGLVGLGWLASYASPAFVSTGFLSRGWFSLNNALPLVPLSERFEHLDNKSPAWVSNTFAFQKVAGFLLATVLVGALTLLGG